MDYSERLCRLRTSVSEADESVKEINRMLDNIRGNYRLLQQLETSDVSVRYLPLEHSKHRKFIECITLILDIAKHTHMNQNMSALESTKPSGINLSLQHEEAANEINVQILQMLERVMVELRSFYPRLCFGNKPPQTNEKSL